MHLGGFDHLIQRWRNVASGLPDGRTGDNTQYSMADIALSASSMISTRPSTRPGCWRPCAR